MRFGLRRLADYSDEAILNEIRRVAEVIQHATVSRSEFRKHSRVSLSTVSRHFGCWEKAVAAAGLVGRFDSSNKAIWKDEVLAERRRVAHARISAGTVRKSLWKLA